MCLFVWIHCQSINRSAVRAVCHFHKIFCSHWCVTTRWYSEIDVFLLDLGTSHHSIHDYFKLMMNEYCTVRKSLLDILCLRACHRRSRFSVTFYFEFPLYVDSWLFYCLMIEKVQLIPFYRDNSQHVMYTEDHRSHGDDSKSSFLILNHSCICILFYRNLNIKSKFLADVQYFFSSVCKLVACGVNASAVSFVPKWIH